MTKSTLGTAYTRAMVTCVSRTFHKIVIIHNNILTSLSRRMEQYVQAGFRSRITRGEALMISIIHDKERGLSDTAAQLHREMSTNEQKKRAKRTRVHSTNDQVQVTAER